MLSRKRTVNKAFIYVVAVAVSFVCILCMQENAEAATSRKTVTVLGEGTVSVIPDTAYATLGIETSGSDAHKAQSRNKTIMNEIINELKTLGVNEKDIQTVNYSIYPEYQWQGTHNILLGYRVSNQVKVKVDDTERAGAILEAATAKGANVVHGIQFSYSGKSEIYKSALEQALKDAEHKAKILTGFFSYKKFKVIAMEEISQGNCLSGTYCRGMDAGGLLQLSSGTMDVQALVKVTFEY